MLFESYRGTSKFINSVWYAESLCQQFIFQIFFDGIEKSTFSELWENLQHIFFSFSPNEISSYITLTVLNGKLIENVLHIFCSGQSWYDHWILWQWTSLKLSGHNKFVLCKKVSRLFSTKLQFGTHRQTYVKIWFWEKERNLWCRFSHSS